MVDIAALLRVLPVSGLAPQPLAFIRGFLEKPPDDWKEPYIEFLEPPAGLHVPFIDPVEALTILLRYEGKNPDAALAKAKACHEELRQRVKVPHRVIFYDYLMYSSPECLSVAVFSDFLREKELVSPETIDYLERITVAITEAPLFEGPGNWRSAWPLPAMPDLPPPKAMIEFFPGPPWDEEYSPVVPYETWREAMRPVAANLEAALGESVYHFADPDDDCDDDNLHRFLAIHWCCTSYPDSAFVQFMLGVSGAANLEELKDALIDPKNYVHPFKMNDAFFGLESHICRVEYSPPARRKCVGIVFSAPVAKTWAGHLALQQINADIFLVAPEDLIPKEWCESVTRNGRHWTVSHLRDGIVREPIDLLARLDELNVIADDYCGKRWCGFQVSESIQDLLWQSVRFGIPIRYFYPDSMEDGNPDSSLRRTETSKRVAAQDKQREAYTRQLEEIRLECDFASSGLWNTKGAMLGYDLLSIPFPIVHRLAAWQRDFDETYNPPDPGDDAWWEKHRREELEIARDLQEAFGPRPRVMVSEDAGWTWISDIPIENEP